MVHINLSVVFVLAGAIANGIALPFPKPSNDGIKKVTYGETFPSIQDQHDHMGPPQPPSPVPQAHHDQSPVAHSSSQSPFYPPGLPVDHDKSLARVHESPSPIEHHTKIPADPMHWLHHDPESPDHPDHSPRLDHSPSPVHSPSPINSPGKEHNESGSISPVPGSSKRKRTGSVDGSSSSGRPNPPDMQFLQVTINPETGHPVNPRTKKKQQDWVQVKFNPETGLPEGETGERRPRGRPRNK